MTKSTPTNGARARHAAPPRDLDDQISVKVGAGLKRHFQLAAVLEGGNTRSSDLIRRAMEEYAAAHPLPAAIAAEMESQNATEPEPAA
jgi:hypothetical protein